VVINPSGEKIGISLRFSIAHIEEQDGNLAVRIGGGSAQRIQRNTAAQEIWNAVL